MGINGTLKLHVDIEYVIGEIIIMDQFNRH